MKKEFIESINFKKTVYSMDKAKQWIKLNDYKDNRIESDNDFIYFIQERLTNQSQYRTLVKSLGHKTSIYFTMAIKKSKKPAEKTTDNVAEEQPIQGGKINERCLYCV